MFQVMCNHIIDRSDGRNNILPLPKKKKKRNKGHQVSFGERNNDFLARLRVKKRAVGQNDGARRLID